MTNGCYMCDVSYVYKHEIIVFNRAGNISNNAILRPPKKNTYLELLLTIYSLIRPPLFLYTCQGLAGIDRS